MMNIELEALPIGEDAPEVVNVVVEVPVASRNKYEYEPEMGAVMLDRVLPGNVRYPADYGFIPSTISTDDSPMDIFVASYDPVFPGCVIRGPDLRRPGHAYERRQRAQHLRRSPRRRTLRRYEYPGGHARTAPKRRRELLRHLHAAGGERGGGSSELARVGRDLRDHPQGQPSLPRR